MASSVYKEVADLLGVKESFLRALAHAMAEITGKGEVVEKLGKALGIMIQGTLPKINVYHNSATDIRRALKDHLAVQEERLRALVARTEGTNEFEKAANLARSIARAEPGFFLKKALLRDMFAGFEPKNLLAYLGYGSVAELAEREDLVEAMSALRFVESDEWMHEFFQETYSGLTPADFEARPIELRVLGSRWREIAEKFVAKKHHNVSHLKEFGVIFLNPISEDTTGKFIRDFALLLHYFHEIEFYSKLFRRYAGGNDFAERLKSLLRGDLPTGQGMELPKEGTGAAAVDWLIIQRYLVKENPEDPRLSLPRMNPESLHWRKAERDLAAFGKAHPETNLAMWENLDWVGVADPAGGAPSLSFDLEDNAMSLVSASEGKNEYFTYHLREALWTELCADYAGGEAALESLVIEHFGEGIIRFRK